MSNIVNQIGISQIEWAGNLFFTFVGVILLFGVTTVIISMFGGSK